MHVTQAAQWNRPRCYTESKFGEQQPVKVMRVV